MYEPFFQLAERPFPATPRIEHYFPARACEAARRTLVRCIERAEGVGVLIGPSGSGKTLLCEMLAHHFQTTFDVVLLGAVRVDSPRALLQTILHELSLPCRDLPDGDMRLSLIDYLTAPASSNMGLLLVADEAHTLPARVLEEVRLITNISLGGEPRVRLVMAGGPLLEERLSNPKLESFAQRTSARCYLESLDRQETAAFVRAQMAVAGAAGRQAFSEPALASIYRATDGIPRLINQLCDHALVLAFTNRVAHLGEKEIEAAWADLQQLPTPWSGQTPTPADQDDLIQFGQLDDELDELEPAPVGPRLAAGLDETDPRSCDVADEVDEPLCSIEVGAVPRQTTSVEVAHASNPFAEPFDQEEVIVDRYGTADTSVWEQMPHVYSAEGRLLAELLAPHVETAHKPLQVAGTTVFTDADEECLIIVEDDPTVLPHTPQQPERVFRQEYAQLFAKLRRG